MRRAVVITVSALLVTLLTSCEAERRNASQSPGVTTTAPGASAPPKDEASQRAADADHLITEMEAGHPDLFHSITRREFDRAAQEFRERAPLLTDEQFLVEVMRLNALPTLQGRDGHAGVFTFFNPGAELHSLPLRTYEFSDGLFVVDARPPYRDLIGVEIIEIGGASMEEVRSRISPLISRDNSTTVKGRLPPTAMTLEVLKGTGLVDSDSPTLTFSHGSGHTFMRRIEPIPTDEYNDWLGGHMFMLRLPPDPQVLYLSRPKSPAWIKYLADSRTLYAQYNLVENGYLLSERIEGVIRRRRVDRVVFDIRHNPGGDNTQYRSLVDLFSSRVINGKRPLFVIAGRVTFSAAGNLAGELDAATDAIFVGEPPGGSPNQYGDRYEIELPHSGIVAGVPVYFVEVVPGDDRLAIRPDIPAVISSDDFFDHRDPALEAILAR